MPSVTGRQHRFFGFLASHPKEAKKRGVPLTVAHDFLKADRGKHFADKPGDPKTVAGLAPKRK